MMGNFFLIQSQNKKGLKTDSLIQEYNELTKADDSIRYAICKTIFYSSTEVDVRLEYSQKSYEIAERLEDDYLKAGAKYRIALVNKQLGFLNIAYDEFLQALALYTLCNSPRGQISTLSNIGALLTTMQNYTEAEKYFKRALQSMWQEKDTIRYASTLTNLGELKRFQSEPEEAKNHFKKALKLFTLKNHKYGQAINNGNIGLVYLAQDSLAFAIDNLNQSIKILAPLSDNYSVSVYEEGLAHVYQKQKHYKKAEELALQSLALAEEDHLIEQIRDAQHRLSEIYKESKQPLKAYNAHVAYVNYKDSLINEKNIREIENLRRQYEVAEKQREVDELTKEQEYYKTIGISLGIIILLAISLAGVQLYHSRRRKRINLKLKEQQKELEQLNETKDKFFSIISHDLRSPIATFQSFTEVFDVMVEHQEYDKLKVVASQMKQSSASIIDLVDNLFNWGLNQKGEIPYDPQNVNLREQTKIIIDVLGEMARIKGIQLSNQIDPSIYLTADVHMLQAILRNLANNALKFTFSGGSVSILAEQNAKTISIIVRDTGVGISSDKLNHLFELDANKSTAGTMNERGVGLGLRLVYEFVERHKGTIQVKSIVASGTDMIVELPLDVRT